MNKESVSQKEIPSKINSASRTKSRMSPSGQHPLLQMQQNIGNHGVLHLLRMGKSPTRLTMGQPGDHQLTQPASRTDSTLLQRKIASNTNAPLDAYFKSIGIIGYTHVGNVYSHSGATGVNLETDIVYQMLASGRLFSVVGDNERDAIGHLENHVIARRGIVNFAAQKRYKFAAGAGMVMNPDFWVKVGDHFEVKAGVDRMDAFNDLNVHPEKYNIACQAATVITMLGGSGGANLIKDTNVTNNDWIPGDWGYITNLKFADNPRPGLEGENIIYTGTGLFWGHFTGSNTYRTINDWTSSVQSWAPNGAAQVESYRIRPETGLW